MTPGDQHPPGASPVPPPFSGAATQTQWWEPATSPGPAGDGSSSNQHAGATVGQSSAPATPAPIATPGTGTNMSPRQRRLTADARELLSGFQGHPNVSVQAVGAQPPERYQVIYNLPALVTNQFNSLQVTNQHVVHVILPAGYPREKPYCTCDSAVFHPNFGNYICIADFWSPSRSIVDVVVQIGDMLQYKLYNVRSPLNAVAARWVSQHLDRVPISNVNLQPSMPDVQIASQVEAQQ